MKFIIVLLLQYPFQWFKGREEWFYERIRLPFCDTVNPLQLSKYLIEQNCLNVTDLVRNINNENALYVMCLNIAFSLRGYLDAFSNQFLTKNR